MSVEAQHVNVKNNLKLLTYLDNLSSNKIIKSKLYSQEDKIFLDKDRKLSIFDILTWKGIFNLLPLEIVEKLSQNFVVLTERGKLNHYELKIANHYTDYEKSFGVNCEYSKELMEVISLLISEEAKLLSLREVKFLFRDILKNELKDENIYKIAWDDKRGAFADATSRISLERNQPEHSDIWYELYVIGFLAKGENGYKEQDIIKGEYDELTPEMIDELRSFFINPLADRVIFDFMKEIHEEAKKYLITMTSRKNSVKETLLYPNSLNDDYFKNIINTLAIANILIEKYNKDLRELYKYFENMLVQNLYIIRHVSNTNSRRLDLNNRYVEKLLRGVNFKAKTGLTASTCKKTYFETIKYFGFDKGRVFTNNIKMDTEEIISCVVELKEQYSPFIDIPLNKQNDNVIYIPRLLDYLLYLIYYLDIEKAKQVAPEIITPSCSEDLVSSTIIYSEKMEEHTRCINRYFFLCNVKFFEDIIHQNESATDMTVIIKGIRLFKNFFFELSQSHHKFTITKYLDANVDIKPLNFFQVLASE